MTTKTPRTRRQWQAWTAGYAAACKTRWEADAWLAFAAGFDAGHNWDGTLSGAPDNIDIIRAAWDEYQHPDEYNREPS